MTGTPKASRPHMPGYGILDADAGRGLLPWTWASDRLARSHNYWVATTRPDGRPHVMPVWGVWLDDGFYFSTGVNTRKAQNLAANPRCVVCTECADEAVILEGTAEEVTAQSLPPQFKDVYFEKYKWDVDPSEGGIYAVRPRVAFAFIENPEDFAGAATRWRFSDEPAAPDSNAD